MLWYPPQILSMSKVQPKFDFKTASEDLRTKRHFDFNFGFNFVFHFGFRFSILVSDFTKTKRREGGKNATEASRRGGGGNTDRLTSRFAIIQVRTTAAHRRLVGFKSVVPILNDISKHCVIYKTNVRGFIDY